MPEDKPSGHKRSVTLPEVVGGWYFLADRIKTDPKGLGQYVLKKASKSVSACILFFVFLSYSLKKSFKKPLAIQTWLFASTVQTTASPLIARTHFCFD